MKLRAAVLTLPLLCFLSGRLVAAPAPQAATKPVAGGPVRSSGAASASPAASSVSPRGPVPASGAAPSPVAAPRPGTTQRGFAHRGANPPLIGGVARSSQGNTAGISGSIANRKP